MRRAGPHVLLALLLGSLLVLPLGRASAGPAASYKPVPPDLAAVAADEREQALAAMGLNGLARRAGNPTLARALLVMLGDVGLKAVAERLAEGGLPRAMRPHLLEVVASSEHPAADWLLERASHEPRPVLRMIAADGLGRGRSPLAVPTLARLATDPVPGVRIAALRSLFAIESPQARAARLNAPVDIETALLATRLRWHRRCEDASPALRQVAVRALGTSRSVALRMEAARYLTRPEVEAPIAILERIITEMGTGPLLAWLHRLAFGLPQEGYDPVAMRRIAIDAALTLLERTELAGDKRRQLIDQAIGWVAHPVAMDPYSKDPIPEYRLRRRLPDFGAQILAPVVKRLFRGDFAEPRRGAILLRELGPDLALPVLLKLLTPRDEVPALESHAEAEQRRYLRNAAAGVLQELGHVGDETLARRLLFGEEAPALKIDILRALVGDEGTWVVPLLGDVVAGEDAGLRSYALDVLQRRPEPEARSILVEDLFERMDNPYDRIKPLVTRADKPSLQTLERALADKRSYMRKAALSQFNRRSNPRLCGPAGQPLLLAHEPAQTSPQEIQDYVYALLNALPEHAVAYVQKHWASLPTNSIRMTVLRILGEARGTKARQAAIDLALEKVKGNVPMEMLLSASAVFMGPRIDASGAYGWTYRRKDVGAFWKRLLAANDVRLQREAVRAYDHVKAPAALDRLLELLALALDGKALPENDSTPMGEQAFARELISALRHQGRAAVEEQFIDIATDPLADMETRLFVAWHLIGHLSETGRQRLITRLDFTTQLDVTTSTDLAAPSDASPLEPDARASRPRINGLVQLFLAAAVGEGADAAVAGSLYATLRRELFGFYSPARLTSLLKEGPSAIEEGVVEDRVKALARGIGHTGHAPTVEALLTLVFDLRFAMYARVCVRKQRTVAGEAATSSAASVPSRLNRELVHDDSGTPYWGMPISVYSILYELKRLDDAKLATAMERVLHAAVADGRLSHFPSLFMYRVVTNLLHRETGRKPKTAAVVLRYAQRIGRLDDPIHYMLANKSVLELAEAGRFEEAAKAQTDAVRILARGNHDDRTPGLWLYQRSVQDALEGAASAQRGDVERARQRFRRAVLRAPNDPNVLNGVAWYRALAAFDLEDAEAEALRATRLEARVETRPSPQAADTLAYVLLQRGKAREGLRVLLPRMREEGAVRDGLTHLHLGQLYANVGMFASARKALIGALTWDRALEAAMRVDPYLLGLRAQVSIDALAEAAAQQRLEEQLP